MLFFQEMFSCKKTNIPLNQKILTGKIEIWLFVSSIMIRYIWKAMCWKVLQNMTKRPPHIITRIWTEVMHYLKFCFG